MMPTYPMRKIEIINMTKFSDKDLAQTIMAQIAKVHGTEEEE